MGKITKKDFKLCIRLAKHLFFVYVKNCCKASCGWLSCLNGVDHLKIEAMTFQIMYNMFRFCMGKDEITLPEQIYFFASTNGCQIDG